MKTVTISAGTLKEQGFDAFDAGGKVVAPDVPTELTDEEWAVLKASLPDLKDRFGATVKVEGEDKPDDTTSKSGSR